MAEENAVMGLIESEARKFGFEKAVLYDARDSIFAVRTSVQPVKLNGKYELAFETDTRTLYVGTARFEELVKKYEVLPDVVSNVIRASIRHEKSHTEKVAATHKVMKMQIEVAIRKYGVEKFGLLSEGDAGEFIKNAVYSKAAEAERESQVNMQTMADALNEPRMDVEKIKDGIASYLWLCDEPLVEETIPKVLKQWETLGYQIDDSMREEARPRTQEHLWGIRFDSEFNGLNCKGDVIEKAKKIDEKYRSKLK